MQHGSDRRGTLPLTWRPAVENDLNAMMAIQLEVHPLLQERAEVFVAKLRLDPAGCKILDRGGESAGYGLAHAWRLNDVPPLDKVLAAIPAGADCLFIHDVALRPAARRQGVAALFVGEMRRVAHDRGLPALALVSVYGTVPIWEACGFRVRSLASLAAAMGPFGEEARYMVSA